MKTPSKVLLIAASILMISCRQQETDVNAGTILFPTQEPTFSPEQTSQQSELPTTAAQVELTATPNIGTWVIGGVVEEWQKPAINTVVQSYWSLLYHPPAGVPDCVGAAAHINTPFDNFKDAVLQACQGFAEEKYFVRWLPLPNHSVQYYTKDEFADTEDQFRAVIVELDTLDSWTADVFYLPDGGYYGKTQRPRTVVRLFLRISNDQWWVYAGQLQVLE